MKRLLLVAYAFPPQRNPESLLVLATVRALTASGWIVTVLTIHPTDIGESLDQELLAQVPGSVSVVRTGGFRRLANVQRFAWNGLRIFGLPEQQCAWYASALAAGRRILATGQFDVIHSWASYHTSNIVARRLHKQFLIPWVAHFSDPWIDSPYFIARAPILQRFSCARLERKVIGDADAVVFVTNEALRLVMKKYPKSWLKKANIVPHGYDPEILARVPTPHVRERHTGDPLLMVHTGAFYPGLREPLWLLRAVAKMNNELSVADRLRIRLVGPYSDHYLSDVRDLGLSTIVDLIPPMTRLESLVEARSADVLLVIDAPAEENVFLPSKLIDYLMLRKPILGLTPRKGATARILEEVGYQVTPPDDVNGIAAAIECLLLSHEQGRLTIPKGFPSRANEYHIAVTTRKLSALLEDVIDGKKRS